MSRTRMMYSAGIPMVGGGDPLPGRVPSTEAAAVFFVDPNRGSDGNPGDNKDQPLQTWAKAHSLAPSDGGAVIYGFPTLDADEAITITKDNIAFVNARRGPWRCTIKSTAGIPLTVNGYGFAAYGMQFNGIAAGKESVRQQENGYRYVDCDFISTLSHGMRLFPDNTADGIAASEGQLYDCWFRDCGDVGLTFENPGPAAGLGGTGPVGVKLDGCWFDNNTNQDILDIDTAGSNDNCFFRSAIQNCKFTTRNKAVYVRLNNGGNNSGFLWRCGFAKDNARLDNTMVLLATAIVAAEIYDATGLVDTSGF